MRAAVAVAGLAAVFGAAWWGMSASEQTHPGCEVLHKYTVLDTGAEGKAYSQKRVETSCGVFRVEDTMFPRLVTDSATRYGLLQPGRTYDLDTVGWRVPLTSTFPIIIDSEEIP